MATPYNSHRTRKTATPQSEAASPTQIENSAGGFSFALDDWKRLDRFLVLGSDAGSYYIGTKELTKENAQVVERLLKVDGVRVVNKIVEISDAGRAIKNEPALFALAMAAAADDAATRKAALLALPKVVRIGTHLFHFAEYVEGFRGWGRALREAVSHWYQDKSVRDLAYQAVKYQSRDGWSHRDMLRLSHPKTTEEARNELYSWMVGKKTDVSDVKSIVHGFEQIKKAATAKEAIKLIAEFKLPREAIPTQFLNDVKVWEALLPGMPLTALIRNLGKMTEIGLIAQGSDAAKEIAARFADAEDIKKARVHPMTILTALRTYDQGHGFKGKLNWTPVQRVSDALDSAFYLAFGNVEPTGKRLVLALDVSGSMSAAVAGDSVLSCAEAEAAMALITANVEKDYEIMAFGDSFKPLNITPKMTIAQALKATRQANFGGTDCALPMMWALGYDSNSTSWSQRSSGYTKTARQNVVKTDAFVVYTDNETWAGATHPHEALKKYRSETGIPAKLVVVGMASNGFTIADPNDSGMMDVAGLDSAVPNVISDFIRA